MLIGLEVDAAVATKDGVGVFLAIPIPNQG